MQGPTVRRSPQRRRRAAAGEVPGALGFPDTPFVMVDISLARELVIRGNMTLAGLRELAEVLAEAANEARKWAANDDQVH